MVFISGFAAHVSAQKLPELLNAKLVRWTSPEDENVTRYFIVGGTTDSGRYSSKVYEVLIGETTEFICNEMRDIPEGTKVLAAMPARIDKTEIFSALLISERHVFDNAIQLFWGDGKSVEIAREIAPREEFMGLTEIRPGVSVLFGGVDSTNTVSDRIWTFDEVSRTYTQLPYSLPQGGRYGCTTFNTGTHTFALGGRGADHSINGTPLVLDHSNPYLTWDVPSVEGFLPSFIADPLGAQFGSTMFVAGGKGYVYTKGGGDQEQISTQLYRITATGTALRGEIIAIDFPPLFGGVAFVDTLGGDTVFYAIAGASEITQEGKVIASKNVFRYKIKAQTIEKFDTTSNAWVSAIVSARDRAYDFPEELTIAPLPAEDVFSIEMPEGHTAESLMIFNSNGLLVRSVKNPYLNDISSEGLPKGAYILRVVSGEKVFFGKLIKL